MIVIRVIDNHLDMKGGRRMSDRFSYVARIKSENIIIVSLFTA